VNTYILLGALFLKVVFHTIILPDNPSIRITMLIYQFSPYILTKSIGIKVLLLNINNGPKVQVIIANVLLQFSSDYGIVNFNNISDKNYHMYTNFSRKFKSFHYFSSSYDFA